MVAEMSCGLTKQTALAAPKIFQLHQQLGAQDVVKLIVAILRAFVDSVRVAAKPDAADLMEAAEELAHTYTHDSVKDIMLALKEARTSGVKFYNTLDVGTLYGLVSDYMDRKANYLETRHRDQKTAGPSHDAAVVASLASGGEIVSAILSRRLDPAHPNRDSLRRKLTITKGREARGLITPEQARQQRQEVEAANYRHATRRHVTPPQP